MLIRVQELELRKLEFNEDYQPGAIEFGFDLHRLARCTPRVAPNWWLNIADTGTMFETYGW